MKRMFVDTPGGQIHCRAEGTGFPVLLLHQVPNSSSEFMGVIPILSQNFRVLAMDLPLYGDSYKPARPPVLEDLAQSVLDFMDALEIDKAHVAGHHTGASVAVELAVEHRQRVERLVLSGCLSFSRVDRLAWLNDPRYRDLKVTPDGWFMQHIWEYVMQRIPDDMDKAYELALDCLKGGIRVEEGHRAAFRYDILPKLKKIKQPTLAICGDRDTLFPYHQATLKHIRHAESYVIRGGTTQAPRLLPQEWGQAVLQFLTK